MAVRASVNARKAKAAEERREQQFAALKLWFQVMVVVCIVGAGMFWGVKTLTDPKLLPLKVVRTDGKLRHLKRHDLEQAVAGLTREGFLTVDVAAVRDRAKSLPWVDKVSVRRIWPDSLQLWVEEHVPLSRWGDKAMLNVRGEVFRPDSGAIPAGLPLLSGPDGSEKELARYYMDIKTRLAPLGVTVTEMVMDERRAWTMKLKNGAAIKLGSKDLDDKLARFYRIYPLLSADKRELKEVDMRYINGFAVTWKSVAPTAGLWLKTETLRGLV